MTPPQALLFDLGGVVVDIDFDRALAAWAPHSALPLPELKQAFRFDDAYQRHERGEIDGRAYFEHLAQVLRLDASLEQIASGWNAIFVGERASTLAAIEALRPALASYAFTNTNATHMACWSQRYPRLGAAFERIFASHELGLRKPERAAFERVVQGIGVAPQAVLFFDDLEDNVEAARQAGLQGVHVRSAADVIERLAALPGDVAPRP